MNDLSQIKQVSLADLHSFLIQDHTSFSVLSLSAKHIISTDRLSISLTKNSAKSFYLGASRPQKSPGSEVYRSAYGSPTPEDNCFSDAQNCVYFQFFSSQEKKLSTRFKDKVETNFEGTANSGPLLFITLTFNTTQSHYSAWTTNWDKTDECWNQLNQKQSWLKSWAQAFDHPAEPLQVQMEKVSAEVSQHSTASYYLELFLRRVRRLWKPSNWKWVVVTAWTSLSTKFKNRLASDQQTITETQTKVNEAHHKLELQMKENSENEKVLETLLKEFQELEKEL